jgi:hypothetical protein
MKNDDYKYRKDLESLVAKLGKRWKNLPIEEVIRFCTKFRVLSSIKEGKFLVLKLKRK